MRHATINYSTNYQIADNILQNICREVTTMVDISKFLSEPIDQITTVLDMMEMDGFIKRNENNSLIIKATIKGNDFYADGGYRQFIVDQDFQRQASRRQDRVAKRLLYANWTIAVGTIVAAIYYGIELWKFFSNYSCK